LSYTTVSAPFDGVVTARKVSLGELVGGSHTSELATIVQLNPIWVWFNLTEADVQRVRVHMAKNNVNVTELVGQVSAVSQCGAADHLGHHQLPRGERPGRGRYRRAADRATGQRRRPHDLHAILERLRRQLYAHRHVQDRNGHQLRAGAGAEQGLRRARAVAGGGAVPGRYSAAEVHRDSAIRHAHLPGWPIRQPVPLQTTPWGKFLAGSFHFGSTGGGDIERVRLQRLIDADGGRGLAVERGYLAVALGAEIDAGNVAHADHLPVFLGLDDDVLELADVVEASRNSAPLMPPR